MTELTRWILDIVLIGVGFGVLKYDLFQMKKDIKELKGDLLSVKLTLKDHESNMKDFVRWDALKDICAPIEKRIDKHECDIDQIKERVTTIELKCCG